MVGLAGQSLLTLRAWRQMNRLTIRFSSALFALLQCPFRCSSGIFAMSYSVANFGGQYPIARLAVTNKAEHWIPLLTNQEPFRRNVPGEKSRKVGL
jgi:hypothetical protein